MGYEDGLVVALLLWIWNAIMIIVMINSKMERNINRIGQRLSWTTLEPEPMKASDIHRPFLSSAGKYLLIIGIGFVFSFLSWAAVALKMGSLIYRWGKNYGKPQAVREFEWKLKNMDMPFDQIIKESMKVSDIDPKEFEQYRSSLLQDLYERGLQ